MARPYRKFTQEEIELAQQLREQGLSFAKIGREINRAPTSVEHRLAVESGAYYSLARQCLDCEIPIPDANATGCCRKCGMARQNRDPEFQARRVAAVRDCDALKAGSPARIEAARKAVITRMANPVYVAWLKEQMRSVVGPAGRNAYRDHKAAGRKISEFYMKWCPVEYRPLYHEIKRAGGLNKAEAQELILAQIRDDLAKLSPFERQERALAKGAALVANDRGPLFGEVLRAVAG